MDSETVAVVIATVAILMVLVALGLTTLAVNAAVRGLSQPPTSTQPSGPIPERCTCPEWWWQSRPHLRQYKRETGPAHALDCPMYLVWLAEYEEGTQGPSGAEDTSMLGRPS